MAAKKKAKAPKAFYAWLVDDPQVALIFGSKPKTSNESCYECGKPRTVVNCFEDTYLGDYDQIKGALKGVPMVMDRVYKLTITVEEA